MISISQLCHEGLKVIFNREDCQAVDENGNTVLFGIKYGNKWYMWKPSERYLSSTESQLDMWHIRLGDMNSHGLNRLVKAEPVRGLPKLEDTTDVVCEACNKGKQIKMHHKQVFEISTKRVLELVHMDLMDHVQTESLFGK